jgi:hypothetical protein
MQVQFFAVAGAVGGFALFADSGAADSYSLLIHHVLTSIINQTLPLQIPQIQPIIPRRMIPARLPSLISHLPAICLEFLKKTDRPQRNSTQQAEECRPELPQPNKNPASRSEKFDKLVDLVQVVLTRNIIPVVVSIMFELKDCNEFYRRAVERDEPDAEDLGEGYVEEEVRFVKR